MAARVDELCDAVKSAIESSMVPGAATVTVADIAEVDRDSISGRQVYVGWDRYFDRGPATRGVQQWGYLIRVSVVEEYTTAGVMSNSWRRDRTEWVKKNVVDCLGDAREKLDGAYADSIEIGENREDELTERKLYWSEVLVTLVEDDEDC